MAETKRIPSKNPILRALNRLQDMDLPIPMTKKFANRLSKLQRKLQIKERDVKNPNEMKKLMMGDKRWDKHIDAILDEARAKREKKEKQKKEDLDRTRNIGIHEVYVTNKKGGKVKSKYSTGGGVRKSKYSL
jgi:hypothetical protein